MAISALETVAIPARPRVVGRRGGVRLTRRGRVVLIVLSLLLAAVATVLAAPASQAADPAGAPPSIVVRSGDTLWSIATRYVPSDDPFAAIDEIRQLNGLSGYTIKAGQRLTLPRHR
jgi:LysM repeat protein